MIQVPRAVAVAVALAACAAAGCGTSAAPRDGGTAGSGSGGAGGAAGSPAPACPGTPPVSGASCTGSETCFYEDCGGSGRTVARCANGAWSVETGPCTGVTCESQSCSPGQVCVERIGGALIVQCAQNTCGTGAIGCGCLQSCAGTCTVGGSIQSGVTIQCNTCPSNTCP
jgi:hypothetical protein